MATTPRRLVPAPEPDYAVPPGDTLRERLEELGMSQAELARRTGLTPKHINQVVGGTASLSAEVAQRLEYATGVPSRWWLRLEADYRATQARLDQEHATDVASDWVGLAPVAALVKAGALPAEPTDPSSRFRQLLAFFGVANLDAYTAVFGQAAVSYRRSRAYEMNSIAVAAWLRLGELAAQSISIRERYDAEQLQELLPRLRSLTRLPVGDAVPEAVQLLATSGVVIVVVPEVEGARAYGATRWIEARSRPLIQLSLRGRTDDQLWQTLFHEIGHVLLHDRRRLFVESNVDDADAANPPAAEPAETEAEDFARSLIVPHERSEHLSFITTLEELHDFADEVDVSAGLVVARLHSDGIWPRNRGANLKRRVPDSVVAGWEPELLPTATLARRARRSAWALPKGWPS